MALRLTMFVYEGIIGMGYFADELEPPPRVGSAQAAERDDAADKPAPASIDQPRGVGERHR
jgi:hypothetical protein